MGRYEVTQNLWRAVTGENPSYFADCGDDCPVENISWHDALRFCNGLSVLEGLTPVYGIHGDSVTLDRSADGYRLPTEAEWEYACRARIATAFHSGTIREVGCGIDRNLDRVGWYCGSSNVGYTSCYDASRSEGGKCAGAHPVGRKARNGFGLYDMHGNVWEWCWDRYREYRVGHEIDPQGPPVGSGRVMRGGSWYYNARDCRSANRTYNSPGGRSFHVGLRLCRSVE